MKKIVFFILLLFIFLPIAWAQNDLSQNNLSVVKKQLVSFQLQPQQVFAFVNKLKMAVRHHRVKMMAQMIAYPLTVNGKPTIQNKQAFIHSYSALFTSQVKKAIANQKLEALFVNYQGVMLGNGEIWINKQWTNGKAGGKLYIIAVNNAENMV